MNDTGRVIFLLRDNNDIDHITPIISRYMDLHPELSFYGYICDINKSYDNDFRLNYLRNKGAIIQHTIKFRSEKYKRLYFYFTSRPHNIHQIIAKFLRKISKQIPYSSEQFCQNLFHQHGEKLSVILHDHTPDKFLKIVRHAKIKGIATIALPHAADNFDSTLVMDDDIDPYAIKKLPCCYENDLVILPSFYTYERLLDQKVIKQHQAKVLGSARFSIAWNNFELRSILPPTCLPDTDKFKILMIMPKGNQNNFMAEIQRILIFVSKIKNVELSVKIHTRGNEKKHRTYIDEKKLKLNGINIYGDETLSCNLIDWADLTLFTTSSVIFDNIVQDRPVIHLRRTSANKIMFERIMKKWSVDTREELFERIISLQNNNINRTYSINEREALITEMVQPAGENVCDLYVEAITEEINKKLNIK